GSTGIPVEAMSNCRRRSSGSNSGHSKANARPWSAAATGSTRTSGFTAPGMTTSEFGNRANTGILEESLQRWPPRVTPVAGGAMISLWLTAAGAILGMLFLSTPAQAQPILNRVEELLRDQLGGAISQTPSEEQGYLGLIGDDTPDGSGVQ